MPAGESASEEESDRSNFSLSAVSALTYAAVAASPLAIVFGSLLPLEVLLLLAAGGAGVLVMQLFGRAKRRLAAEDASKESQEVEAEEEVEDLVQSEREATWSGEYRHRMDPGLYYGEAVKKVVRVVVLTDEEKATRKELIHRVTSVVHTAFPGSSATSAPEGSGASLTACGSFAAKTCLQGRNLDLFLRIVEELGSEEDVASALCSALWEEDMEEVTVRTRADKQIVRFLEPDSGVTVDVAINATEARLTSLLLREYASVSKRALQLIVLVKHWAQRREICTSFTGGTLNSYGYTLLVVSFLQRRELPVVPVFPCDRMGCSKSRAASFGATRAGFLESARASEEAHEGARELVGRLLIAFFDFYGNEFDAKKSVVSVRTGELLRKRSHQKASPLVVEDPISPTRNVAASVTSEGLHRIRKEFRRAARILNTTPASRKLWRRFLSTPLASGSNIELSCDEAEPELLEDDDDDLECHDCSECEQLTHFSPKRM